MTLSQIAAARLKFCSFGGYLVFVSLKQTIVMLCFARRSWISSLCLFILLQLSCAILSLLILVYCCCFDFGSYYVCCCLLLCVFLYFFFALIFDVNSSVKSIFSN